jgi:hypothetical protein
MLIRVGQHLDTESILPLQKRQGSRWCHLSNEITLAITCCLLAVHQAHVCRLHNNTAVTAESLQAEWCALLHSIILTKRCTVIVLGTPSSSLYGDIC